MAFVPPITCNYNSFFDFDYSFSSNPDEKKDENSIIAGLVDLKNSEISAGQQAALGSALASLQAQISPKLPGFDKSK